MIFWVFANVDQFSSDKKHPIFLKPLSVAFFMQNSFQMTFLLNLLETIEVWGFMGENQWFFLAKKVRQKIQIH